MTALVLMAAAACATPPPPEQDPSLRATIRAAAPSRAGRPVVAVDREAAATADARAAAAAVAGAALREFCAPALARPAWLGGLDRSLTLEAADAYATVDPSRVPCTRLTGTPRMENGDDYTQDALVATDAGSYRLTVTRQSTTAAWLVESITPAGPSR